MAAAGFLKVRGSEMTHLHFSYHMEINYEETVSRCHFTIKCIPKEDERQHLAGMEISLVPDTGYSWGKDSFGNRKIYGCVTKPHRRFLFTVSGDVEILQTDWVEKEREERTGIFRFPYGKCVAGEGLARYFKSLEPFDGIHPFPWCLAVMHRLYQDLSYVPGSTWVSTGAEEAWGQRKGVCQDYVHIFITLLRMAGIPARYVCGLIAGEGASHAWAEALCMGRWIAFDPTNDCLVLDRHIKLGDGRDASDCAINRGILWGGGRQSQKVGALVR